MGGIHAGVRARPIARSQDEEPAACQPAHDEWRHGERAASCARLAGGLRCSEAMACRPACSAFCEGRDNCGSHMTTPLEQRRLMRPLHWNSDGFTSHKRESQAPRDFTSTLMSCHVKRESLAARDRAPLSKQKQRRFLFGLRMRDRLICLVCE